MIDLVNVRKSFGDLEVLKDINLHIHEKEIYGIIGQSGAGKSTLLRCINGLETYESGTITVDGTTVNVKDKQQLRQLRKDMGMIFQNFNLLSRLDVYDNVALPLSFWGENPKTPENKQKIEHLIELVGLKDKMHERPSNLSGGQKQRVSLAGIMHDDVEILLFDEPLAALDPQMGNQAIELIDEIQKENNKTVLIIEHRLEDVLYRPVDRIILMNEGEIISDTTPDKLLSEGKLHENGIREPLYLSALKMAGCDFTEEDHPSDIFSMSLDQYKDKVVSYFNEAPKAAAKTFGECLLEVNDVSFRYKNRAEKVLDHVSFKVYKGEKIAVIGKNGAGKSTIAKMICGVLRPDEGEIKINGENYLKYSIKEIG